MGAPMTIGDLLVIGELALVQLAGPPVRDRPVRWAHPTELLRPGRYLRGGELVLTVGSALTTDEACETFVAEVAAASATAIGLGVGDVHDEAPAALLDACRRHAVPLLAVPHGIPFQSLAELIAEHRVTSRVAGMRRSSRLVARLLDAMVQEASAPAVAVPDGDGATGTALAELAAELDGRLVLVDADGTVEFAVGEPGSAPPIAVDLPGERSGRLLWHPAAEPDAATATATREALQELAHPLAVWRHERAERHARAERDLGRLLRLVLDGRASTAALTDRLDPVRPVAATVWQPEAAARLRTAFPDLPRALMDDRLLMFAPDPEAVQALARAWAFPCGLGETLPVADAARSIRQAAATFDLSARRGRPVAAHELATVDALLDHLPEERLQPFVDQLLVPLLEHDRAAGSGLTETLRAYLDGGAAVIPVARTLFVHPNTLRHRLGRIAEITGRSPFVLADRVAFFIALRIAERSGPEPAPRRGRALLRPPAGAAPRPPAGAAPRPPAGPARARPEGGPQAPV